MSTIDREVLRPTVTTWHDKKVERLFKNNKIKKPLLSYLLNLYALLHLITAQ
jgi:hypothetical protein